MTLGPYAKKFMESFSEEERVQIEAEFQQEKAEYLTLQELRQSLDKTQTDVANVLNVRQVSISALEKGKDPRISTVQDFIAALGGDLEITVKFPGRPPIILKGFGDDKESKPMAG